MNKDEFKILGKEFKAMVKDFVDTGNTHKMTRDAGRTVNSALDLAFEEVRKAVNSIQVERQHDQWEPASQPQNQYRKPMKQQPYKPSDIFPHAPVGKVAGILYTIFGSIGIGVLGTAVILSTILSSFSSGMIIITPVTLGLLIPLVVSVALEMKGSTIRNRLKRFRRYLSLINGRSCCWIKDLSAYSGFNEKYIVGDLRKMISIGMFPQAHMDEKKTFVMLNHESYELYLTQQAELKARQAEEQQKEAEREKTRPVKGNASANVESHSAIAEGKMYLRQINEAKAAISNADVSMKVRRMEEIIGRIIDYVEIHPERLPEVRRLMAYYLPTTIKLLGAYREFDRQPIQGDNITKAKSEIESAFDTINLAFESLLDSLFEKAVWDVSTDISVLQTIFAQEGLTESNFKGKT